MGLLDSKHKKAEKWVDAGEQVQAVFTGELDNGALEARAAGALIGGLLASAAIQGAVSAGSTMRMVVVTDRRIIVVDTQNKRVHDVLDRGRELRQLRGGLFPVVEVGHECVIVKGRQGAEVERAEALRPKKVVSRPDKLRNRPGTRPPAPTE